MFNLVKVADSIESIRPETESPETILECKQLLDRFTALFQENFCSYGNNTKQPYVSIKLD